MSDAAICSASMTLADFDRSLSMRSDETRWELIDGVAQMVTNPLLNHGLIAGNIFAPLKLHLVGEDCRAFAGSLRVQRSDDPGETFAAIPDIVVQCGSRPNKAFTTNAVAVFEILSRSTLHGDRGVKFDFYRSIQTMRHIVFAYQNQMRVEHYRRTDGGWLLSELVQPASRLVLDHLGFELDLGAVYEDVPVLRGVAPEVADAVDDDEASPPSEDRTALRPIRSLKGDSRPPRDRGTRGCASSTAETMPVRAARRARPGFIRTRTVPNPQYVRTPFARPAAPGAGV